MLDDDEYCFLLYAIFFARNASDARCQGRLFARKNHLFQSGVSASSAWPHKKVGDNAHDIPASDIDG